MNCDVHSYFVQVPFACIYRDYPRISILDHAPCKREQRHNNRFLLDVI
jgi:hypothetical protein